MIGHERGVAVFVGTEKAHKKMLAMEKCDVNHHQGVKKGKWSHYCLDGDCLWMVPKERVDT